MNQTINPSAPLKKRASPLRDRTVYSLLRLACWFICIWPAKWQRRILTTGVLLVTRRLSRFEGVACKNLELAFPQSTTHWRRRVIEDSHEALARLFADLLRLDKLDRGWIMRHVEHSSLARLENLPTLHSGRGIIFATGHLGSFELLGHALAVLRRPLCFVAREFSNPAVNRWWQAKRAGYGNRRINSKRAYRPILERIQEGTDVAVPIDQNVRIEQGVFVDWFGQPAATSSAVARAALKTGAAVVVLSMVNEGGERYRIKAEPCDYSDIYRDRARSKEEKILAITQRVSDRFCEMIAQQPGQWFWMHRRWKTAPLGMRPGFYSRT